MVPQDTKKLQVFDYFYIVPYSGSLLILKIAQGIVAGINAALAAKNAPPLILDRSDAFIGVLIDDLVTLGTNEPYRMFTSRAEYRLSLRADNADFRLTRLGYKAGCVSEMRMKALIEKENSVRNAWTLLRSINMSPNDWQKFGIKVNFDGIKRDASVILGFTGNTMATLCKVLFII